MKKGGIIEGLLGFIAILAILGKGLIYIGIGVGILAIVAIFIIGIYAIIESLYFNGKKFASLKNELSENTQKFNELNEHIRELKSVSSYSSTDYGDAAYLDNSEFNYRRPYLSQIHNNTPNEYFCSLSVCKNAQTQPFKYLCKYFGIPIDEDSLNVFESILNDFSAAEEGKRILLKEREEIKENHKKSIPFIIRLFRMEYCLGMLGYTKIDVTDAHFPRYYFKYISPGGNSSMTCEIVLNIENLERFVSFLYSQVEMKKTVRYQRALMTERLRTAIKERDNYTCQICGASVKQEPNLLLEIDHIIPVSRNGETTMDNLQTLCWRCNRRKGNKI